MTEREKLIDLIIAAKRGDPETGSFTEWLTDYLLANGVTVQRWIPVEERLPEEDGDYLVVTAKGKVAQTYFFKECDALARPRMKNVFGYTNVTHWMPLPEPPKEVFP